MKRIISTFGLIYLSACTIQPAGNNLVNSECVGSIELDPQVAQLFAVADEQ